MKRPSILTGALVGLLATAPLTAVLFLAWRVASAPFSPFDLFDWLARALPGPVVTFGIDTMVSVLRTVAPGSVAELAKPAEQTLAIAQFLVLGAVVGAAVFAIGRATDGRGTMRAALAAGGLGAALAIVVGARAEVSPLADPAGILWLVATFVACGATIGWSWNRLARPADVDASASRLDRRRFLVRLGGATAVLTVAGAGVGSLVGRSREDILVSTSNNSAAPETWSASNVLPNAGADLAPAPGTRPEFTPLDEHYRIDINTISPSVDETGWNLTVHGLVASPMEYTLADLRGYPALDQFITLACISNRIAGDLIGTQRWTGVSLQRLLPEWGLDESATHLLMRSVDGFFEVIALETIRNDERVMLAYAWDDLPLRREHGFPLRIYIPDRYGMKQPKWLESIEVMDHWEAGYWVERGWSREAIMNTASVIDTVAAESLLERDGQTLVPIGGIAHAGVRGVSRVEVQVDDEPWQDARLRQPISEKTWVLWRYDWPFQEGSHTFAVRCYDGDGTMQILEPSSVRPDGATGVHSVTRTI